MEEGLRKVIEERQQGHGFRLRRATFRGQGLKPQVSDASWEQLRELIYQGRGA